MLLGIDSFWVEYTRRVLTLLCCAERPLTVPEVIDAVAVELGDSPKLNKRRRLGGVEAIHEVCPGFIVIDEQSSTEAPTVRIAHFSIQEYLQSDRILQRTTAKFSVQKRDAHTEMACICLAYLLVPALLPADWREEYPLASYAANNWFRHFGDDRNESFQHVQHYALRLFREATAFENWVKMWETDNPIESEPTGQIPSRVYHASYLGLFTVLTGLLEGGIVSPSRPSESEATSEVSSPGGFYGNALQAASARGHEAVVRHLLEKGADINTQGGFYGKPTPGGDNKRSRGRGTVAVRKRRHRRRDRQARTHTSARSFWAGQQSDNPTPSPARRCCRLCRRYWSHSNFVCGIEWGS